MIKTRRVGSIPILDSLGKESVSKVDYDTSESWIKNRYLRKNLTIVRQLTKQGTIVKQNKNRQN